MDGKLPKGFFHHYSVELVRGFYNESDQPMPKSLPRSTRNSLGPAACNKTEDTAGGSLQKELHDTKIQLAVALAKCDDLEKQNQTLVRELQDRRELQVRLRCSG